MPLVLGRQTQSFTLADLAHCESPFRTGYLGFEGVISILLVLLESSARHDTRSNLRCLPRAGWRLFNAFDGIPACIFRESPDRSRHD
jgi:hypothetical protein